MVEDQSKHRHDWGLGWVVVPLGRSNRPPLLLLLSLTWLSCLQCPWLFFSSTWLGTCRAGRTHPHFFFSSFLPFFFFFRVSLPSAFNFNNFFHPVDFLLLPLLPLPPLFPLPLPSFVALDTFDTALGTPTSDFLRLPVSTTSCNRLRMCSH